MALMMWQAEILRDAQAREAEINRRRAAGENGCLCGSCVGKDKDGARESKNEKKDERDDSGVSEDVKKGEREDENHDQSGLSVD